MKDLYSSTISQEYMRNGFVFQGKRRNTRTEVDRCTCGKITETKSKVGQVT